MRRIPYLLLLTVMLLAACNGGGATSTPVPPTAESASVDATTAPEITASPVGTTPDFNATASAEPTREQSAQRVFETGEPTQLIPGTIVAASTPDLNAGLVFDSILLERTGGLAGIPLTIEVKSDGTVTRDGTASTISPDQVTLIDNILDQLNFFGLQGVFEAPGTSADVYQYSVTVTRAGSSRTVRADDGFLPPELQQLLLILTDIGAPTQ
jgi:hypothetical protein